MTRRAGQRKWAEGFLRELLSAGSVPVTSIRLKAASAGITLRTLRRAKRALGVRASKAGFSGGWTWTLAEGGHTTTEQAQTPKGANGNEWPSSQSAVAILETNLPALSVLWDGSKIKSLVAPRKVADALKTDPGGLAEILRRAREFRQRTGCLTCGDATGNGLLCRRCKVAMTLAKRPEAEG